MPYKSGVVFVLLVFGFPDQFVILGAEEFGGRKSRETAIDVLSVSTRLGLMKYDVT
jgi:hypothetical protein